VWTGLKLLWKTVKYAISKYPDDIIAHFYTKIFGRSLSKHDGDQGSENGT